MATVHLARQIGAAGFARMVAIKRLHERYSRDPEFVAMFLDEARIVGRIRHPNVVQTIDVVAEHGELFLVMEYVHGESLLRILQTAHRKGKELPIPVAAAIVAGALRGLHEAHEARSESGEPLGVVHRDVSPHNILVGVDGVARVLDFGVAKATQRIQTTQTGHLKGKLSYMAPEQVRSAAVDRRTDVYAAAVVLWESLTGAKKFYGDSEAAVLGKILLDPHRAPSTLNRAVTPELDAVVMKGLAREPEERFADARTMAEAIERAVPLATASQVSDALAEICGDSISVRQEIIASVEARSSLTNLQEAVVSLRTLGQRSTPAPSLSGAMPSADPHSASRLASSADPHSASRFPPAADPHSASRLPVSAPILSFPPTVAEQGRAGREPRSRAMVAVVAMTSAVVALVMIGSGLYVLSGLRARAQAAASAAGSATPATALDAAASVSPDPSSSGALAPETHAAGSTSCPSGMAFIPGGRFFMGSDEDLPAEKPAHKVAVSGFCMDKPEVTVDRYRACSDRGDCKRAGTTNRWEGITARESKVYDPLCNAGDASRGSHPINCIDWAMADRFCKAEGKRLPTEAEWEYAARGSDGRKFPWGDAAPTPKHLNACGNECVLWGKKHGERLEGMFTDSDPFAATAPVGSFPSGASRWGIEDIVGNVWEWVADFYAAYADADVTDPKGPAAGATRVMRGGAWNGGYPDWVRPSFRFHASPDTRSHGVGFRCVSSP
ncbi:MAG: SUMF1/EgtB/PvdO family nonheme iron enzyme [Deltaproteobacteria bacterium]|nr:SUMF1/EgtB/PvdO family nonheme iron enzyme [Deltaproteobacteria bacterium]